MASSTIANIDQVYSASRLMSLNTHFVAFPRLASFSSALFSFTRELGENNDETYWQDFVRPLKRYRFDISAAPLLDAYLNEYATSIRIRLERHLDDCHLMFPAFAQDAFGLLRQLEKLCQNRQDHLLASTIDLAENIGKATGEVALLIKESRLLEEAVTALGMVPATAGWTVLHPLNLREPATYSRLIVIGRPQWFPEYVFSAPRAPLIDVVCYDWIPIRWKTESAFLAPAKGKRNVHRISHNPTTGGIGEDILPPSPDIERVIRDARSELENSKDEDFVEALLLVLEGEQGVFIEAEGHATALVIDLSEERSKRVKRITHQQVAPGMYVLVRTSGGGDYVVPVANRLLGEQAEEVREMQQTWKARLRMAVKQQGIRNVVGGLQEKGSDIANYQNVRNWMSERSISTQDPADFKAIMEFTGLGERYKVYWRAMKTIRRAHTRAGQHIRRLLMQEVNQSNLADLERVGLMEFSLPDRDAGSLTAYRIRSIAPQSTEVVPSRIDVPFPLEEM